ncbi:hypothetical protein DEV92_11244 [Phyllobacterium myrsinacearum]|uniref:Lytic murein transglycosylase n=1 Tax=Phyllobacterium myrsinacearum TaxID=28101 RepID=A0A2S9JJQ8_9HYPH|nr:lytic murein transglycosylase [Phyllobacterium myrsinacearum]PWV87676.1 hypothetical protein DEV92_11244 [Phyllobacterium myrsinacearum]RZV07773.1 hypothetical protein EV654_2450 [Phyllobacterium myrsinacearum]
MSVQNEFEFFTPLCPAGHLPHKGGDQLSLLPRSVLRHCKASENVDADVISPLVGEMGGSPEGGI